MTAKPAKPKKPHADFPLTPHAGGRWCKKVGQKMYYFGRWDDPQAALQEYLAIRADLQAGRDPRKDVPVAGGTLGDLINFWLTQKEAAMHLGELSPRTFADYVGIGNTVAAHFGKHTPAGGLTPQGFARFRTEVATQYAPVRLTKIVTVVRMIFKWAWESEHIEKPMKFGPDFKIASKKVVREARSASEKRLYGPDEVKVILEAAGPVLKAMTLLGVNCGLGNTDIGELRHEHLRDGWMCMPRTKTCVPRRVPMWPETVAAIEAVQTVAPKDPANAGLVFLTRCGQPWVRTNNDEVAKQFAKLLRTLGLYRAKRTFYALRHTCQTVGDDSKDPVAVSAIMGHVDGSMAGEYREEVRDSRLLAVTDTIRRWLFLDGGDTRGIAIGTHEKASIGIQERPTALDRIATG